VREYQLPSGLAVLLLRDPAAPIVAYQTWFRVGSRHEQPGRTGLAHLFEHLMFNETERLKPGEFDRRLESIGADTNAATWLDWTYYRDNVPAAHLETVVELEAERMAHLVLHEPQLETERGVVSNERRQRVDDDVDGFLGEELYRLAYQRHPYRWPTIGWMEDIQAITLEDARAFYRTWYAPNNATLVLVGDFEEAAALAMIERHYGGLAPQAIPVEQRVVEPEQVAERRVEFERPVMSDRLLLGWRAVGIADEDHAALEIAAELLCNGQSSSVYKRLVIDTEVASSVTAEVPGFRDPGLLEIRASLQRGHAAEEAERIIVEEIARLAAHPVPAELLEKGKNRLEARFFRHLRPHEGKAEALGHHQTTAGDFRLLFRAAEHIRAVTPEGLQRAIARYLSPRRCNVVVARPPRPARSARAGRKAAT